MNNHFVVCSCSTPEHTIRFLHDRDEDELYTEIYLNQYKGFFKRLVIAVRYLFGYTCRYGHWDSTLISKEEAQKLKHFLGNYTK